jgi:hypothetical protein
VSYGFGGLPEKTILVDVWLTGLGSNVVLATLAVLLIWPREPFGTMAIVIVRPARGPIVPRLQVTSDPARLQLGSSTATWSLLSSGRLSVTTTFSASPGPLFVTLSVYVI